jgi:asparagine synthetase B (glutamine-hydrolysing)
MCGIFSIISKNKELNINEIKECFEKGKNRGPEESRIVNYQEKNIFGFHRLAINGIEDVTAMQPFNIENYILICW